MKNLPALLLLLLSQNTFSQTENPPEAQPKFFWKKGFWAEFALGGNFGDRPDLSAAPLAPEATLPAAGFNFQFQLGYTFRRRWGLQFLARQIPAQVQAGLFQQNLEKNFPDFFIINRSFFYPEKSATHILWGLHALPLVRGRWFLEADLLAGITEIRVSSAAVELKKRDSNELIWLKFKPSDGRVSDWQYSTTVLAGLRGGYFLTPKIRLVGGVDLAWMAHRLEFSRETIWQIDQSRSVENVVLQQQQWLGGVFFGVVWMPDFSWWSRRRGFRK